MSVMRRAQLLCTKLLHSTRRGDTLIEVSFAIAVFALVSLISISLMNVGVTMSEASLESTMTRNEIDAQAEALRFIQTSYLSELELAQNQQIYHDLWTNLTAQAINGSQLDDFPATLTECATVYADNNAMLSSHKAFVVNTRNVNPSDVNGTYIRSNLAADRDKFAPATLNPRLIFSNNSGVTQEDLLVENTTTNNNANRYYNHVARVEGIWVIAVKGDDTAAPEFYDFHIRSCWYAPGNDNPTTIATIIRLYNPDFKVQ